MSRRLLVLDDDPDINTYVKKILLKEEYLVETTTNFNDFFECFKKNKPDICLVDLNLGDVNGAGFNILKAIRNKYGDEVKVIIISRRFSEEDIQHALINGANDYITKPLDDVLLKSKVNSAFGDMFKESSALPFYAVAASSRDSFVRLPFKVMSLHEQFILIHSTQFIAKGNLVKAYGNLAKKISPDKDLSLTISEIQKNVELDGYNIKLSFNHEDEVLIKTVRKILLNII